MGLRESSLRASDADRDAAADQLRAAWMEGRLDAEEFEQRLARVLGSRTYGELGGMLADLPSVRTPGSRRPVAAMVLAAVAMAVVAVVAPLVLAIVAGWMIWVGGWLLVAAMRGRGCCTPARHSRSALGGPA